MGGRNAAEYFALLETQLRLAEACCVFVSRRRPGGIRGSGQGRAEEG